MAGERLPGVAIHHTGLGIARGDLARRPKKVVQVYAAEKPESRRPTNIDQVD